MSLTDAYNVLAKLRAGTTPSALAGRDKVIFDAALVLVLKELHDDVDAAVADAYIWPNDLEDDEILARLFALNKARAQEEARGTVRWVRRAFQEPRFGVPDQQVGRKGIAVATKNKTVAKPSFPRSEIGQTAAVMAALAQAAAPIWANAIAAEFRQKPMLEESTGAILAALVRLGFATSPDGDGRSPCEGRVDPPSKWVFTVRGAALRDRK